MGFEDKVRRVPAWCAIFVYHVVTKCNFNTDGTEKKDLHSKLPGKQKGLSYSPMPEIALLLSSPSMILNKQHRRWQLAGRIQGYLCATLSQRGLAVEGGRALLGGDLRKNRVSTEL